MTNHYDECEPSGEARRFTRTTPTSTATGAGMWRSRMATMSTTSVSPAIKQNWSKLAAGWHWQWSDHVNWDMQAAVNSVISGIKAAGQVVGAVVEVVAMS